MDGLNVAGHVGQPLATHRSSWREAWVVAITVALPTVLAVLAAWLSLSRPSDDVAAARFLAHEGDFQRLAVMVHSDGGRVSGGREPVGLDDLAAAGADGDVYRLLLTRIGATGLRYFPRSGMIILPISTSEAAIAGMSESYLYSDRERSNQVLGTQRSSLRGPGVAPISGDLHIKGGWYVHREGVVGGGVVPY